MRLRFATIELFPKRHLGEQNQSGLKLVRVTPTTGGAGRKLLSKLLERAGVAADTSTERAEQAAGRETAADREPQQRPTDARGEDPLGR